jgi:polyisoprenoid-binding protein YceI
MSTDTAVTAGTWTIDPSHTEIGFTVRHLVSKVRGKFETFEGTITSAPDITASTVNVSIDLASVNTGSVDRDAHLRSGDFFNAEENPKMTFVSTGIVAKGGNDFVVTGDLTIKGVTKSVALDTEFLGEGGDPWGGTRVGLEATTTISRKEFGIDFNIPVDGADKLMIGDKITINIVAEAVLSA